MASAFFVKNQTNPVSSVNELGIFVQLPADGPASLAISKYVALHPVEVGDVLRAIDAAFVSSVQAVPAGITFQPVTVSNPPSGT